LIFEGGGGRIPVSGETGFLPGGDYEIGGVSISFHNSII